MKLIALYLPQYYENEDNNRWWGKGFTDWFTVQNAEPLFEGHKQPIVPLHDNYYDLSQKETMQWQASILEQYGVYGVCFYHYWFKDGRKTLEKPAEKLLKWTDINMRFCFSWDSNSWDRTWSAVRKAKGWSESDTENVSTVMIEQKIGDREEWYEHFVYLLSFFKDERYIQKDEKPVFIFYAPESIPGIRRMTDYWQELAIQNGLKGIYFIYDTSYDTYNSPKHPLMYREPMSAFGQISQPEHIYEYQDICQAICEREVKPEEYTCMVTGYDDSPRTLNAHIIQNSTPELFEKALCQVLLKNESCGNEFVFINAWNEWAEGMHLEPDEAFGYGESIK